MRPEPPASSHHYSLPPQAGRGRKRRADPEARPAPRPASGRLLALAYCWPLVPYTRAASPACSTASHLPAWDPVWPHEAALHPAEASEDASLPEPGEFLLASWISVGNALAMGNFNRYSVDMEDSSEDEAPALRGRGRGRGARGTRGRATPRGRGGRGGRGGAEANIFGVGEQQERGRRERRREAAQQGVGAEGVGPAEAPNLQEQRVAGGVGLVQPDLDPDHHPNHDLQETRTANLLAEARPEEEAGTPPRWTMDHLIIGADGELTHREAVLEAVHQLALSGESHTSIVWVEVARDIRERNHQGALWKLTHFSFVFLQLSLELTT